MRHVDCLFPLLLVGCSTGKSSDTSDGFHADTAGDADVDTDTDTDADADTDVDTGEDTAEPQTTINVLWETEGVTITIENGPLTAYQLGMLDTLNEDGWRGEDCLNGMAGHLHCHPLGETGGNLATVFDVNLVEDGLTTRHTHAEGTEGALTYALLDPDGNCLGTWGHLPDYFTSSALACPEASSD